MSALDLGDSRYHRQELITWWDQARLRNSRVLLVGAGALGNEVAKNLALVGVGHVEIVDMDTIEHSNLARCVFFRESDEGSPKSEALARAISAVNSDVNSRAHVMPVQRLGIGYLGNFDLVIGALDSREARAWVNQACRKLGILWIDGAIEGLRGVARVFGPEGPCYMCTLGETDFKQMSHRKSCALLAPDEIISGKTPTNATTASVIAGVQSQEAVKALVGRIDLISIIGKGWVFTGDSMDSYVTNYREDDFCLDHDRYEELVGPVNGGSIFEVVTECGVAPDAVVSIDFEEDLISLIPCPDCGGEPKTQLRSAFGLGAGKCSSCESELIGSTTTSVQLDDPISRVPLYSLGLAQSDVITIRTASERIHVIVEGKPIEKS